jgi:hypothetical protein
MHDYPQIKTSWLLGQRHLSLYVIQFRARRMQAYLLWPLRMGHRCAAHGYNQQLPHVTASVPVSRSSLVRVIAFKVKVSIQ